MRISYVLRRLKEAGYTITRLGKNIKAERKGEVIKGSITHVFTTVFGYK